MDKDDRYTRITLRIPKDLHARLADAAEATSKSMNAEIIARLEESFALEAALEDVAPGVPVVGAAGLLLDAHSQLIEWKAGARHDAMTAYEDEIEEHFHSTDTRLASVESQLQQILALLQAK